jgi:HlyD family secretion protein
MTAEVLKSLVKQKTVRRSFLSAVILAALIGAFFLIRSNASSILSGSSTSVEDVVLGSRSMTFWVDATGMLRATSVRNFSAPPPFSNYWQFQIVSMAPEGQAVKSGDQLLGFDAQKVRDDLQRFRSELDQATKELEKTRVSIDLERQELTAKLATAQNNFEKCKLKQGISSEIEASSVIEKDGLDLEQARREVEALKERLEWHTKSSEASYNIILSRKARAQNKVDTIQKGTEGFQAKADRDGVVVYKVKWNGERFKVGENIWAGEPVMEIPDLNTIIAEAFIPEVDIGKVQIGQRVELTIDAFPGKSFTGTVKSFGTLVRPKAWDIPNKVLDVQIALDQLDTAVMRPSMSIKVKIETGAIVDCLAVPLKAVLTTAEGAMVKVKSDAGWRQQKVKLGDSNGVDVVVMEGLTAGERVALNFSRAK